MAKQFGICCLMCTLCINLLFTSIGISQPAKPNIIYILTDDLGYGDVSYLNSNSKLQTPHMDAIAQRGMAFTDAHSNSSVCSPTRYGILTGRYAWRTHLQNGVLWSYDSMLMVKERATVASLLQKAGYQTACIGKWHLGLNWQYDAAGKPDITKPVTYGPNDIGFDYFYGIAASLDLPPYVYVQNNSITASSIDSIAGTSGMGFWRPGLIGNDFIHEEALPHLTQKAEEYIHASQKKSQPFFLYLPLPSPHTPILPTKEFQGKSGTNAYGDFVLMTDAMVGRVLDAVKQAGIEDNTLIIFTSDNGCSPMAGFEELAEKGHDPSYVFRGAKADIYEGGHRIPFLVKWPGKVQPGTFSDATICLTDFMATVADITKQPLSAKAAEDSYSLLPLFIQTGTYARSSIIHHSIDGNFSIREGEWKLCLSRGSGGWSAPTEKQAAEQQLTYPQLYDLKNDIAETNNVARQYPEKVKSLMAQLTAIVENGRSTPGPALKNDIPVDFKKIK